jgi:hypothetical protein
MRRLPLTLLPLLALVGLVPAADPVVAENPVPADSFAEVRLPVAAGESVLWEVTPAPTKQTEHVADGAAVLHFNGPPGPYAVSAIVINFEAKSVSRKRLAVTLGKGPQPKPDPKPQPKPDPKPDPAPEPTGVPKRFVVVEETAQAGDWRGQVLGSPKVAAFYKAGGYSHRLIDVNAEAADPAAVAYQKLAAGKPQPYLWICDDAGRVLKELPCPKDADAFVAAFDLHNGPRALGAKLEKPKLKWVKFGETPKTPLIPRDRWKPVDLSAYLPPVYDQDGVGQCASSSACTVLEAARAQAGLPYVRFSAGDLYARVNGGRDNGSMPEENLTELLERGALPVSAANPNVWNGRRAATDAASVAARRPNRAAEAYLCDSFDSMASALQQGFLIQEAIWWHDGDKVDAEGWLPARGSGGRGGHALAGYGLTQRAGAWGIQTRNSWGATFGVGGNCVIPESRFSWEFGAVWAVRAVVQSPSAFPAPKLSLVRPTFADADRFVLAP